MSKLNNKGQSLVLFIIIIPILLGIMALVIDLGNSLNKKNETNNVIEYILNYGLSNKEVLLIEDKEYYNEELINLKDELEILLNHNLKENNNKVIIKDKVITITSKTYVEGIFTNILNIKGFEIESKYEGYIENEKEIIKKIK